MDRDGKARDGGARGAAAGTRCTVGDVVRAWRAEKRREELYGEWGAVVAYRPLSFVLTPWLVNAGIGAAPVTAAALAVGLALPALALAGGASGYALVALGAVVVAVLDCVDGNIARVAGTASRLGEYADFIVDVVFRLAFYASIALLVPFDWAAVPVVTDHALAVALGAAWLAVAARLGRVYAENRLGGGNPYAAPEAAGGRRLGPAGWVFAVVSGLDPLLPFVVLAAGYFGVLGWVLAWLLVYSAGDFAATQAGVVRLLRR